MVKPVFTIKKSGKIENSHVITAGREVFVCTVTSGESPGGTKSSSGGRSMHLGGWKEKEPPKKGGSSSTGRRQKATHEMNYL